MNQRIKNLYSQARSAGYPAGHALHTAKTVAEFEDLEREGYVKLELEPEQESYFDVYGEPDGYVNQFGRKVSAADERKELEDLIERLGVWCSVGSFRIDLDNDDWELADSCGMHCGYNDPADWRENWYIPDIMSETIRQFRLAIEDANRPIDALPYG